MSDTQTIILLLILAANLGSMLLYFKLERTMTEIDGCEYERFHTIRENIRQEALVTRQRIAQVKTRLADEERQNQKDLAKARYDRNKEQRAKV